MTPDNAEQMLRQEEIKWAVWEKSLFAKVAKGAYSTDVYKLLE